eukprot:1154417-Amphidinium_carterae.1
MQSEQPSQQWKESQSEQPSTSSWLGKSKWQNSNPSRTTWNSASQGTTWSSSLWSLEPGMHIIYGSRSRFSERPLQSVTHSASISEPSRLKLKQQLSPHMCVIRKCSKILCLLEHNGRAQKPARFARTLPRGDRTDMPDVMYGEFLPPTVHLEKMRGLRNPMDVPTVDHK